MRHFTLNITEIPTYNDGIFFLYKIVHEGDTFPVEKIAKLYEEPFCYNDLSLTDNIMFENDKRSNKITKKIRIPQDRSLSSRNVLEIDNIFYQVFNIYHFKNKDGYLESDITLQEYKSAIILERSK